MGTRSPELLTKPMRKLCTGSVTSLISPEVMQGIALKAVMVLPALLLQKPHPRAKSKDLTV